MTDDPREEARKGFEAGDWERSRSASMAALEIDAEDLEALRLAGKSGVELASEDAVSLLQKAVTLQPDDATAWHDLGEALAAEGRVQEATDAFRKAVELQPDSAEALVDFGHSAFVSGQRQEAIDALAKSSELSQDPATLRALVDMQRDAGRLEEALAVAERLAAEDSEDVLAALDVAEINLALDRPDQALAGFERVRDADEDEPEHAVYALHGMIQAEMRRDGWERAHELAQEAMRLDATGRTEGLLGFFAGQASGPSAHPASGRGEVDAALAASLAEHRRMHSEERTGF